MSIVKKLFTSYKSQIQKTKASPYLLLVPLFLISYFPVIAGIAADPAPLKEITVVSDDNYPPFIFRDENNHLQGILVDEWRLWEEKTGIKVDLRGMDWDKAQKTMAEGKAQVIDTIFFTEERSKTLAFSAPYASIDVPIFFHRDISGIKDVKSLHGFTIGVKAGDACIDYLKKHGIHTLREYPSYESIVRDAAQQKIKVFCIDAPPAQYYLYKMNLEREYRRTAPMYTGQFHRAGPKGRRDILKAVEEGFAKISGKEHAEIEERWRGSTIVPPRYWTYLFYLMGGLVILGAILILWNHILRRKVTQKTAQLQEAIDGLGKSEDKYRNLFENASEAIFVAQDGKLVFLNPMTTIMSGYSGEELMAKPFIEFIYADDRDMVIDKHLRRMKGEGITHRYSFRIIHKGGNIRWMELNAVLTNWNGNPATLNFMNDITERKQAEEALNANKAQLSTALEMAHLGHWEYDVAADLFTFNDHFYKIFRTTVGQVGGYTMHSAEYTGRFVHPDDFDMVREETQKAIETTDPNFNRQIEHRILYADYTVGYITVRFFIVKDSNGRTVKTYGVNQDITDRKRAEEEKRSLEERLSRAEKMEALGQLAGGVAHELNNVLGILSGYSELLLQEIPEGQRSRGHVEKILQSTEKGAAIIQDLLTLARRGVTGSDVINLNSVVSGFFRTPVFEKMRDHHPRVTFRTECDENLLNIKGSPLHLEKTLMNLVSNAAESIPGMGEVTIRTESRYLDTPLRGYDEVREGDYAVLTVSDTGIGIPIENRERIFEPFYTKKTMGRSGTGLGLAIVWGTVKDHNGYIDVQTEVGEGTTFTLYFPATREDLIAQQPKIPVEQYMGNGESVLVVDDISEQRDIAAQLLTRLGYQVHRISGGEEAVEFLKGNSADILLLDMIMAPGIDGLETYRRVLEVKPRQKAIIVSGFSETERVKAAQKLGAGAYVRKPYTIEKIGMAIHEELKRK